MAIVSQYHDTSLHLNISMIMPKGNDIKSQVCIAIHQYTILNMDTHIETLATYCNTPMHHGIINVPSIAVQYFLHALISVNSVCLYFHSS